MRYLLLLSLLISNSALAHKAKYSLWNKILSGDHVPVPDAQVCSQDKDLKEQCVQEICSDYDSKSRYPMMVNGDNFEKFISNNSKKMTEEEERDLDIFVDKHLKNIAGHIKAVENLPMEELMKDKDDRFFQDIARDFGMNHCILQTLHEKVIIECDPKVPAGLIKATRNYFLKDYEEDYSNALLSSYKSIEDYKKEIAALKTKHEKGFHALKKEVEDALAKDPNHYETDFYKKEVTVKILKENWENPENLDHVGFTYFMKALTELNSEARFAGPSMCGDEECKKFGQTLFKDQFSEKIKSLKTKMNDPHFKKSIKASLKTSWSISSNLPDEKEVEKFNVHKDDVIKRILASQKEIMSAHSFEAYKENLAKVNVQFDDGSFYPPQITKEPYLPDQSSFLSNLLSDKVEDLIHFENFPNYLITDHYHDYTFDEIDEEPNQFHVKFSLYSLNDPKIGKEIFAHELGHHYSHMHQYGLFSEHTTKTITEAKSCIHERYQAASKKGDLNPGLYYEEEEFADEFGFNAFPDNFEKLFCPILLKEGDKENLNILSSMDPHPATLWRLINQNLFNGEMIPAACQELINSYSNQYQFKKCL